MNSQSDFCTLAVVQIAQHAQKHIKELMEGHVLEQLDSATLRRVLERQNAVMALLISELELESGSHSHD
jgi:hypothetical protein